jgi:hypothetical protein
MNTGLAAVLFERSEVELEKRSPDWLTIRTTTAF